jgi:hypothetical protein
VAACHQLKKKKKRLSRIQDPDFYPSRSGSNKRGGGKINPTFFVATNITELKIILFLNR